MALQVLKKSYSDKTTEMKIVPVTQMEVTNTIKSLKTEKLSGCDGISNNILKCCANVMSKPVTFICNSLSLASGIYPERFTFAIVWPIHKKGDKIIVTNYTPISLLIIHSQRFLETLMLVD
jgi:hypothetical protein